MFHAQLPLRVALAAGFNPDFDSYSHGGGRPPDREVVVDSLRRARAECVAYRDVHQLGGGHWAGGQVYDASGNRVAQISYNGRVWTPEGWPLATEITTDVDGLPI